MISHKKDNLTYKDKSKSFSFKVESVIEAVEYSCYTDIDLKLGFHSSLIFQPPVPHLHCTILEFISNYIN